MTDYASSIGRMHQAVRRAAVEDTPQSSSEIRIMYTPASYIAAGKEIMNTHSSSDSIKVRGQNSPISRHSRYHDK